ncbi:MAG TPA: hypothetical protein VGK10_14910 [Prolixibacteraceae bacterium]|jgi:hypothetical protein
MRKFILLLVAIALLVFPGKAQNNAFNKGDKVVNLSVGLGNRLYSGSAYSNVTPAIAGSYEVGIKDELFDVNSSLGVGAYVGYTGSKYTYGPGYGWKYSDVIIGARGAVHYQFIEQLDTYVGLMLGYDIVSVKNFGTGVYGSSASGSGFKFDAFVGGRYYFTDRLAVLLELGSGIAVVNLGIAIKL